MYRQPSQCNIENGLSFADCFDEVVASNSRYAKALLIDFTNETFFIQDPVSKHELQPMN